MDPVQVLNDQDVFHRLLRQAAAQAGVDLLAQLAKAGGVRV